MRRLVSGLAATLLVVATLTAPALAQDTTGVSAWLPVVHLAPVNPTISGGQGVDAYGGAVLVPQRRSGSYFDPFALRYATAYPVDDQGDMGFQLLFQMPPVRPENFATIEGYPGGDGVAADLSNEVALGCSPDDSSYCDAPLATGGATVGREAFFGLTVGSQPAVVEHLPGGGSAGLPAPCPPGQGCSGVSGSIPGSIEVWDVIWSNPDANATYRLKLQGAPAGLLNATGLTPDNQAQAQTLVGIAQGLLPLSLSATATPLPAAATPAVALPAALTATSTPAPAAQPAQPTPAPVAASGGPSSATDLIGSQDRPVPLGLTFPTGDGWQLQVQSIQQDASKSLQDFSSFNTAPRADFQYFMASVTVTRTAPGTAQFLTSRLKAMGASGKIYGGGSDNCGVLPNPLSGNSVPATSNATSVTGATGIPSGSFQTGNVCWQVSNQDAGSLTMFYEYLDQSLNLARIFYALR